MNRILGTVVAFAAVLAFGTVSHAASTTYNLTGTSVLQTGSTLAPPPGYFTTPFTAGSYASINTDTNGDSVEGDVSLTAGSLNIIGTTDLGPYGTFLSNTNVALTGGTGTLSGSTILWNSDTAGVTTGTFGCTGAICGLLGITEGTVYPISVYQAFVASQGVVQVNPFSLGSWNYVPGGPGVGSITSLTQSVIATAGAGGPTATWYLFQGGAVPEPGTFALVLLGLGGLALRSRKA
jgi:hypothetical protein